MYCGVFVYCLCIVCNPVYCRYCLYEVYVLLCISYTAYILAICIGRFIVYCLYLLFTAVYTAYICTAGYIVYCLYTVHMYCGVYRILPISSVYCCVYCLYFEVYVLRCLSYTACLVYMCCWYYVDMLVLLSTSSTVYVEPTLAVLAVYLYCCTCILLYMQPVDPCHIVHHACVLRIIHHACVLRMLYFWVLLYLKYIYHAPSIGDPFFCRTHHTGWVSPQPSMRCFSCDAPIL